MNFSSRLKELRQNFNVSQKTLSDLLGVSTRAFRFYEAGEREPGINGLITLASFFAVSLDYLTGRDDEPQYERYIPKTEAIILNTEAVYFVPDKYRDFNQRIKNYSIEERKQILFVLYDVLNDYYESRAQHQETMKSFEPPLYNEFLKRGKYYLQKLGLIEPTVYSVDIDPEEKDRIMKLGQKLHKLLHIESVNDNIK